jgi:type I restriction enzyme S subunit
MMPASSLVATPPREKKSRWHGKRLGDVCEVFADGDWVESKDQSSDGIRLIQTGNVGEGFFKDRAEKARYISEATFKRLRCTEIFEGDCLISRLPDPVGRSCILPDTGERMITAVDCTIVRFKPDQLIPEFFNYYSQSDEYLGTVAKECTGTTRNRISRSNLALTPIPVPPLREQQRIVGILDKAFEGIATAKANAEENLKNARALFESYLQSVFTQRGDSSVVQIGDVAEVFDGPHATPKTVDAGPVFLGISALQDGRVNLGETRHVTLEDFRHWTRRVKPQTDDIVFSYETRLGQAAIIPKGLECCLGRRMGLVRVDRKRLDPRFFVYQYISPPFRGFLDSRTVRGATVDRIALKEFPSFPINLPSLSEQEQMADRFDTLREETQRLASIYERKLAALEALEKSLLHQAFNGNL